MKVPVALFFYKRDTILKVIDQVALYGPDIMFLFSDGGKDEKEHLKCLVLRTLVEKKITWKCELVKKYNDFNIGCDINIPNGLDYVFSKVDSAIILEDDHVADKTFFYFCEELLAKYRDDKRVMQISGTNFLANKQYSEKSYMFSQYSEIWGWATWKSAWEKFDIKMKRWPRIKKSNKLKKILTKKYKVKYWSRYFDKLFSQSQTNELKHTPWDAKWLLTIWDCDGCSIVPRNNLVSNIGFGPDALHTKDPSSKLANHRLSQVDFPLKHPKKIKINKRFDKDYGEFVFNYHHTKSRILISLKNKIRRIIKKILKTYKIS